MTTPPSPTHPAAALTWLRDRLAMTPEAFAALEAVAKKRAFTVAGATHLDLIASVQTAIESALEQGTTFEDFKASVGDKLKDEWQGSVAAPAARLETIYRTNVQSAYQAGRFAEATQPDTLMLRPFWQFDAVADGRTTPECKRANGVVLAASDPWWSRNLPPLHFNCRSTFHPLRRREAERLGVTVATPPDGAAEGFGGTPT